MNKVTRTWSVNGVVVRSGTVILSADEEREELEKNKKRHEDRAAKIIAAGRAAWAWLHAAAEKGALTEDRITKEFETMIPNYGCSCKHSWRDIRLKKPFRSSDQVFWAIDVHNDVNVKLGKPIWPNS